jgi:hypothetical protein
VCPDGLHEDSKGSDRWIFARPTQLVAAFGDGAHCFQFPVQSHAVNGAGHQQRLHVLSLQQGIVNSSAREDVQGLCMWRTQQLPDMIHNADAGW